MKVFRTIHKPDWSWPTRLAPFLHEIMFCLGLSYVKGGATPGYNKHVLSVNTKCQVRLFQSINPFLSSATNISIYHVLMIMPQVLHIFARYSPWHNLQQFKYSKKLTVYIFFTGLCATCFFTVCLVHLVRVRLKMWIGEDLACQNASCIYSKENTDVYNQDTNYNCLYLLYFLTTNIATNKVSCLLYYKTQCKQNTQYVCNWCLQSL